MQRGKVLDKACMGTILITDGLYITIDELNYHLISEFIGLSTVFNDCPPQTKPTESSQWKTAILLFLTVNDFCVLNDAQNVHYSNFSSGCLFEDCPVDRWNIDNGQYWDWWSERWPNCHFLARELSAWQLFPIRLDWFHFRLVSADCHISMLMVVVEGGQGSCDCVAVQNSSAMGHWSKHIIDQCWCDCIVSD